MTLTVSSHQNYSIILSLNVQSSGKWTWVSLYLKCCSFCSQSFKGAKSDLVRGEQQSHRVLGLTTQEHPQFDGFCSRHCWKEAVGCTWATSIKASAQTRSPQHGHPWDLSSPPLRVHGSGWRWDIAAFPGADPSAEVPDPNVCWLLSHWCGCYSSL